MLKMLLKNNYSKTLISKIIIVGVSFLDTVLINRTLSVELRGEYGVVINLITILNLIFSLNIGASYQLFFKKQENFKRMFISFIVLQFLLLSIISFVITFIFQSQYIFCLLMITSIFIFRDNITAINLVENINKRNIIFLCTTVGYTIVLLIVYLLQLSSYELLLYILGGRYFLETIISFGIYHYKSDIRLNLKFFIDNKEKIQTILSNSLAISIIAVLTTCNYNIDVIMLKAFDINNFDIGLYSVASTLVNMTWIIPDAFKEVLIHKLSRYDAKKEVKRSILLNIIISIIIIVGFFILGKWFIVLLYGENYSGAYNLTLILLIGSIPMILYKLINPYLLSINKKKNILFYLTIAVCCNLISNYFVIPVYGAYGAAISSVISYSICGFLFMLGFMKKEKR